MPEPVGAWISVCAPEAIVGQPSCCAGVGPSRWTCAATSTRRRRAASAGAQASMPYGGRTTISTTRCERGREPPTPQGCHRRRLPRVRAGASGGPCRPGPPAARGRPPVHPHSAQARSRRRRLRRGRRWAGRGWLRSRSTTRPRQPFSRDGPASADPLRAGASGADGGTTVADSAASAGRSSIRPDGRGMAGANPATRGRRDGVGRGRGERGRGGISVLLVSSACGPGPPGSPSRPGRCGSSPARAAGG